MLITSIKYTKNNKPFFVIRNKPFLILGTQIRLDGLLHRPVKEAYKDFGTPPKSLTNDEIEIYFKKAKQSGFNTIEVPIDWRFIEPKKDQFDYKLLDFILNIGKKYQLKLELLWFSTNMCGDSHVNHLPDYIFWDKETYPRIQTTENDEYVDERFDMMYGDSGFLILNNQNLMQREAYVLTEMMNHIDIWNNENNLPDTVISVQIHNEPDGFARWRIDQRKPKLNGSYLTKEEAWKMTLEAIDNAGQAVKNSNYKVVTRTNMTVSLDMNSFKEFSQGSAKDVIKLKGIDIVGDDPYVEKPTEIIQSITSYAQENNYPHIAENMGNYQSSPQLILTAVLNGASYSVYDFCTPEYFIWMNKNSEYQMDQGIINPDMTNKPHSLETFKMIKGIDKANYLFAYLENECFSGFNYLDEFAKINHKKVIKTKNYQFEISTSNKAIGYIIETKQYIYLFMTESFEIDLLNLDVDTVIESGRFINESFITESKLNLTRELLGEKLYRLKII